MHPVLWAFYAILFSVVGALALMATFHLPFAIALLDAFAIRFAFWPAPN